MKYIDNLNIKEFNDQMRLSYSSLKEFKKSPLHFLKYQNRDFIETESMLLGSITDCLLLEPKKFDNRYIVVPKIDRRTKEGKETYLNLMEMAKSEEKTIIQEHLYFKSKMMVEAIKENKQAKKIIDNLNGVQTSGAFKYGGFTIKGILDGHGEMNGKKFIFDLKTTNTELNAFAWAKNVVNWDYHLQAFIYNYMQFGNNINDTNFFHVVVSNTEPFDVKVFALDKDFIVHGRKLFMHLLNGFMSCYKNNLWHKGSEFWNDNVEVALCPTYLNENEYIY